MNVLKLKETMGMYKKPDNKPTTLETSQPMGAILIKKKEIKYITSVTRLRKN